MERIVYNKLGQWKLEKGSMRRLAPKPKGGVHSDNADAYNISSEPNAEKRGAFHLLKQMHKDNPHSVKSIDGKPHVLLHRGISGPSKEQNGVEFSNMEVHDDGSLEHDKHGMYTPDPSYASQFARNGGKLHSVWVPVSSINNNSWYDHKLGLNQLINDKDVDDKTKEYLKREGYGSALYSGKDPIESNHIVVKPGKYTHASTEEINNYNNHYGEE